MDKLYQVLVLSMMLISSEVAHSQRAIAFEGIENARDMGGLVMNDGRQLRPDLLLRCGCLAQATDSDVAMLKSRYHLAQVFDFRFEAEAASAPDRMIDGVVYTRLSTLPKALIESFAAGAPDTTKVDMKEMVAVLMKFAFDPRAQALGKQLYPAIVTDTLSQRYYGIFLKGVLRAEGGVLWHCSQGKDRAGWAAAFVLAALGADRDVIVDDFDLSNQSYARQVEAISAEVRKRGGDDEAVGFIRAMVGVSRENFVKTLDLIDQKYGSLTEYVEKQLGFSKEEQLQLREKYLTTDRTSHGQ